MNIKGLVSSLYGTDDGKTITFGINGKINGESVNGVIYVSKTKELTGDARKWIVDKMTKAYADGTLVFEPVQSKADKAAAEIAAKDAKIAAMRQALIASGMSESDVDALMAANA